MQNSKLFFIALTLAAFSFSILLSRELYYIDWKPFVPPIKSQGELLIRSDGRGSGYFGAPRNGNRRHNGIDISAPVGTEVYASRSGRVTVAGRRRGFGNYIELRHRGNLRTIYSHLSEINVREGQRVRQNDVIGKVGKTGNANYRDVAPHLHFEVHKNNVPQDPFAGYLAMSHNTVEPKTTGTEESE